MMKFLHKIAIYTVLTASSAALTGCQNGASTNNPPPGKVQLVAKSAEDAFVERGIDAENRPDALNQPNGIFIEWDFLNEDDISRYRVYRRAGSNVNDSTGSYQNIADVFVSSGESEYLDTDVLQERDYFYYVTAIDEQDQEGPRSAIDQYFLLEKPQLTQPTSNQSFSGRFDFLLPNLGAQFFTFRLERRFTGETFEPLYVQLLEVREGNVQPNQEWPLDDLGIPPLAPGQYRWRVDLRNLNDDRRGSESDWGVFFQQ